MNLFVPNMRKKKFLPLNNYMREEAPSITIIVPGSQYPNIFHRLSDIIQSSTNPSLASVNTTWYAPIYVSPNVDILRRCNLACFGLNILQILVIYIWCLGSVIKPSLGKTKSIKNDCNVTCGNELLHSKSDNANGIYSAAKNNIR